MNCCVGSWECCNSSPLCSAASAGHIATCTTVRSIHAAERAGQPHGQASGLLPPLLGSAVLLVLQVGWHSAKGELVSEHTVRLPRDSTVQQVLDEVKRLANADPQAELRMLEICHNKIFKVRVRSHRLLGSEFQTTIAVHNADVPRQHLRSEPVGSGWCA